jgi:outer membrane biosynthesis protein TonB
MGSAKIVRLLPLAGFVALSVPGQAAEQPPLTLAPTSQWVVDAADDGCALRRTFGDGKSTATVEFRQVSPVDRYELAILSDTLPRTREAPQIRFQPVEERFEPPLQFSATDHRRHGVLFRTTLRPTALTPATEAPPSWPNAERDAREAVVTKLVVTGSFERDLVLPTGGMNEPIEAMRDCVREAVTRWGLDSNAQETLSQTVRPLRQVDWVKRTMEAYPPDMRSQQKSARVPIRLIIGTDGTPTNCVASKGSAELAFEQAACATAMRHYRFDPALDADRQPVMSYYITTIVYQI